MNKKFIFISIISIFIAGGIAYSGGLLKHFGFEEKDALNEWKEKVFHGRVLYEVAKDQGKGFLFAKSQKAASGLFYTISYSPKSFPYISWNWKVSKFPSKNYPEVVSKKSWIERDDYALRFYVIFPSFIFTNTKCLEYIWSEDLSKDTVLTSPFFSNIKLVVLESGSEKITQWRSEERNLYEDYRRAFGRYPPGRVGALALMTDSDNTQSSAEAAYADIKVGYEKALMSPPEIRKIEAFKPKKKKQGFFEYVKEKLGIR